MSAKIILGDNGGILTLPQRVVPVCYSVTVISQQNRVSCAGWDFDVWHACVQIWDVALSLQIASVSHRMAITPTKYYMISSCRHLEVRHPRFKGVMLHCPHWFAPRATAFPSLRRTTVWNHPAAASVYSWGGSGIPHWSCSLHPHETAQPSLRRSTQKIDCLQPKIVYNLFRGFETIS